MKSKVTKEFLEQFEMLPPKIKEQSRKAYTLWKANPNYPSVHFKRVSKQQPIFPVRIGIEYRALGLLQEDTLYWFWIGTHAKYDELLRHL